jgi:hypothetical protein
VPAATILVGLYDGTAPHRNLSIVLLNYLAGEAGAKRANRHNTACSVTQDF